MTPVVNICGNKVDMPHFLSQVNANLQLIITPQDISILSVEAIHNLRIKGKIFIVLSQNIKNYISVDDIYMCMGIKNSEINITQYIII